MPPSAPDSKRCPECGEPADRRGLPISPSLWPARSWAPVVAVLIAASALGAWLALDTEKLVVSSGNFVPRALAPGWTFHEVEQLAHGTVPDGYAPGSLTRGLQVETQPLPPQVGSTAIDVGFGDPPPRLTETWVRGWPVAWMTTVRVRAYENALTGAGWKPARTDVTQRFSSPLEQPRDLTKTPLRPAWEWTGSKLFHLPMPEATRGALLSRMFDLPALLFPIAFTLLLLAAAMSIVRMFSLLSRRRVSPRLRRRMWLAAGLVACAGIALTVLYSTSERTYRVHWVGVRQATLPPAPVYWVYTNLARLPLTRETLLKMEPTAESDQQIAATIVETIASGHQTVDPDGLLAFAAVREGYVPGHDLLCYGRRFILFGTSRGAYVRRGDVGTVEEMPLERADVHLSRQYAGVSVRIPVSSSKDTFTVRLQIGSAILVVLLLWAVWLTARLTALAILRRRVRHRRRSGRCTACGYQISPV